jgi:hypothetical protein
MSTFIRSALIAVALLSSVSVASARFNRDLEDNSRSPSSYDTNNPDDVKAFWEAQQRNGG